MMRRFLEYCYETRRCLLIEWRFHLAAAILVCSLSLVVSLECRDGSWFERSGSIVSLLGGLMTFRNYLRGRWDSWLRDTGEADRGLFRQKDLMNDALAATRQDRRAQKAGLWCIVVGTIIWGYGSVLYAAVGNLMAGRAPFGCH